MSNLDLAATVTGVLLTFSSLSISFVNKNATTKLSQYKCQFLIVFVTTMLLKNNITNKNAVYCSTSAHIGYRM